MGIEMSLNQDNISFEDMAIKLGITLDELVFFAIKEGLINEDGTPTEKALREGLLTIE